MTNYISRNAAKEYACELCGKQGNCNRPEFCRVMVGIDAIPDADAREVKQSKWKLATYSGKFGAARSKWYDQFLDGAFWYCDNCKERARSRTKYCPNCGASMVAIEDGANPQER